MAKTENEAKKVEKETNEEEKPEFEICNSMTQEKELFNPREPGRVGMYVRGVGAYDLRHLGQGACASATLDIFHRYLRHLGYEVTYVRNFTDIDDELSKVEGGLKGLHEENWVLRSMIDQFTHNCRGLQGQLLTAMQKQAHAKIEEVEDVDSDRNDDIYSKQGALVGAGARTLFYPTLLYNAVRNKIQAEFRWWDEVDQIEEVEDVDSDRNDDIYSKQGALVGAVAQTLFYSTLLYNAVRNKIQAEFRWWDEFDQIEEVEDVDSDRNDDIYSKQGALVRAGARTLFYPTLLYNAVRNKIQAKIRWWDEFDQFILSDAFPFPKEVPWLKQLGVGGVITPNELPKVSFPKEVPWLKQLGVGGVFTLSEPYEYHKRELNGKHEEEYVSEVPFRKARVSVRARSDPLARNEKSRKILQVRNKKKRKELKKQKMEEWEVKRLKSEMAEISTDQKGIREGQIHLMEKFKAIEFECVQLREESKFISQQTAETNSRLNLLLKILEAREEKDFAKANNLTVSLRELIARQNEK